MFSLSYNADFDFGYGVATDQEPAAGDTIVDNWVQFELWSDANIGVTLNLLGYHFCQFNVNIKPFHIVPIWFSLYNTHPYRLAQGDDLKLFTQIGYELHAGEVQVQYAFSNLLPKVSLLDVLINNGEILPSKPSLNVETPTLSTHDGWEYVAEIGDLKDDPFLKFNLLEYLITESGSSFQTENYFVGLDFVGDSSLVTL